MGRKRKRQDRGARDLISLWRSIEASNRDSQRLWPAPGSSAAAGSYGSFDAHPIGEGTSNQASSMILARSSGHNLSHRPLKTASFSPSVQ
jgi:hypothetical protein